MNICSDTDLVRKLQAVKPDSIKKTFEIIKVNNFNAFIILRIFRMSSKVGFVKI